MENDQIALPQEAIGGMIEIGIGKLRQWLPLRLRVNYRLGINR